MCKSGAVMLCLWLALNSARRFGNEMAEAKGTGFSRFACQESNMFTFVAMCPSDQHMLTEVTKHIIRPLLKLISNCTQAHADLGPFMEVRTG